MQRLFSTFPNGWPGYGLLLLRVTCGAAALALAGEEVADWSFDAVAWLHLLGGLTAALVLAGLWTPLAASCLALLSIALAFADDPLATTPLIVAMDAMSLVMLGPGAWSIDSRLYGRKRISLGHP
jgi:uncharacterized membrane protein YphA (DoxX/SURF4 family)